MVKSSVLKKVVASILALAAVSTFNVVSCFAMDRDNVPNNQELPDFVITTNNKGEEYDESHAKEIITPETSSNSEDGSELDPDALLEQGKEGKKYDEEYAKEIMSPETSDSSDSNDGSELDPYALI